ncbi:MerR HTH family regulatory protein [Sporobacter termitidis DSM 10068]|uniref:MerR HTH family regulatory protein n=2 Tax=Sporobacter TaxID=44748 RepID=A0A1M5VL25_9FIRM|nr:MerR family transcriptional regulator [Sporobacter termitidis]SHH75935.1 MerR HTH family regulatory protein [Sporobacter termitidis DSM 10068]
MEDTQNRKKIPMRELEKLTNLTRATINFYIKEGLLPPPEKSAKNMAYYDEAFIEKLRFIEKMRKSEFTLNQIKRLIRYDPNTVNEFGLQILESVNRLLPLEGAEAPVTKTQIKDIGFNDEDLETLIKMRIIISEDKNDTQFPAYSLTVCRFVKYFLDLGIPIAVAKDILGKLKELADLEKNAFINYIRSPMLDSNVPQDAQKTEVRKCIENISGLLPILHLQFIKLPNEDFRRFDDEACR